jgi:hypothetical protein
MRWLAYCVQARSEHYLTSPTVATRYGLLCRWGDGARFPFSADFPGSQMGSEESSLQALRETRNRITLVTTPTTRI